MRNSLPSRRNNLSFDFTHNGHLYRVTIGFYPNGRIGELFVNTARANSALDAFISDAAILASIALQHGATLDELRHALKRDSAGSAASPIGEAIHRIMVLV